MRMQKWLYRIEIKIENIHAATKAAQHARDVVVVEKATMNFCIVSDIHNSEKSIIICIALLLTKRQRERDGKLVDLSMGVSWFEAAAKFGNFECSQLRDF